MEEKKKEIKIMLHTLYYRYSFQEEIFKAKSIIAKHFLKCSVFKSTGNWDDYAHKPVHVSRVLYRQQGKYVWCLSLIVFITDNNKLIIEFYC